MSSIGRDRRGLLSSAREMAENKDWTGAGTVCQAMLTALADDYEDIQELDEEGGTAASGEKAVELMAEGPAGSGVGAWRAGWFEAILSAGLTDIRPGGICGACIRGRTYLPGIAVNDSPDPVARVFMMV